MKMKSKRKKSKQTYITFSFDKASIYYDIYSRVPLNLERHPLLKQPKNAYRPSLVLLQWRLFALYLTWQSALKRHHWGRGRFCFCFLARIFLILKVFWDGILFYWGWGGGCSGGGERGEGRGGREGLAMDR